MPFIVINTNADVKVSEEMLNDFSNLAVEVLGKQKNYISVMINTKQKILFGDSLQNIGALIEFKSIGFGDKRLVLAEKIKELAIRYFDAQGLFVGIEFVDMSAQNVSHDGKLME